MATRVKTIEFPLESRTTSLTSTTRHDFAAVTLYIPETTSRTFVSVTCRVTMRSVSNTGSTITSRLLGIKLGAAAFTDTTRTVTMGDGNESVFWTFNENFTSYFGTNFGAGASQTCQIGFVSTGADVINISAKLIITYKYSDAATTQIKTVKIPMESNTTLMTTTLASVGTSQIPLLDTFLPEASVTIRDTWFEFRSKEIGASATDFQFGYRLDGEAETNDGSHESQPNTDPAYELIWRKTFTTSATHNLQVRTTITNKMNAVAAILCVTYEYNEASTSTVLNSLEIPTITEGGSYGASQLFEHDFYIEEPTTITLRQSGVLTTFAGNATGLNIKLGAQAAKGYTLTNGSTIAGCNSIVHRIDSGGSQGASNTLARGKNTFSTTLNPAPNGASSLLILNYTSGKATGGTYTHNKTIKHTVNASTAIIDAASAVFSNQGTSGTLPETLYWINAVGAVSDFAFPVVSTSTGIITHEAGIWISVSGTVKGESPVRCHSIMQLVPTSRFYTCQSFLNCRGISDGDFIYKRHPNDPNTRFDANGTLNLLGSFPTANAWAGGLIYVTYHSITRTVAGTISGYAGDGSGITVDVWRSDIYEKILTLTTTTGGAYTGTWYDNTINLFAEARQDSTHLGRSEIGVAV